MLHQMLQAQRQQVKIKTGGVGVLQIKQPGFGWY